MNHLALLDWPARIVIGVVVAGAVGGGAFLLVRTSGDEGEPTVQGATTAPAATATLASASPTATATAPPSTATVASTNIAPPPEDAPPEPTPDTRVAIMDVPSLNQIQMAKDGTYFIADRGDGCHWTEVGRREDSKLGTQVILGTNCPAGFSFLFRPGSGEVSVLLP